MKKVKVICMALLAMVCLVSCRGPKTNANVYSSTVTVYSSDWRWEDPSWRVDIEYEAISSDITDYGAVLVYMKEGNAWHQLPLTYYYSFFDDNVEYFASVSLEVASYDNGVTIFWTENDFYHGNRPDQHDFKIVVIAASLYNARSDVDYSDYNAVRTAFQLEER